MLRFLEIHHLAVIDHLELELTPGLTVLTGETGAGKSMLVGAIDLLVGGRASVDLVRTGEAAASVQAVFDRPDGTEVLVRREISAQGRSRAFIDGALATSGALRELGATFIDLHGQHEHQALLNPAEHAGLVDAYAGHDALTESVAQLHGAWRTATNALEQTRLSEREKAARIELASFHLAELDRVAPEVDEDETLLAERQMLSNADRLAGLSNDAFAALYDGEAAALSSLAVVWKRVSDLAEIDPRFQPHLDQRDEVNSILEELAFMLRSYSGDLDTSPDRLEVVEDRLAALAGLKKKHGPSLDEVIATRARLTEELAALQAGEERVASLEQEASAAAEQFRREGLALSQARTKAGARLARSLERTLAELSMPHSRVEIRVEPNPESPETWSSLGLDTVEFFLSPNPGEDLRPLARIASGGELSRIMLALKTLATPDEPGRTLVFDEVDSGIGGAAADAVGARLQGLAERFQVICITHLPQIAARGRTHLHIAKQVKAGRTVTTVTGLVDPDREREIARMIAGDAVSTSVLASAKDMLAARQGSEQASKGESENASKAKAKGRRRGA